MDSERFEVSSTLTLFSIVNSLRERVKDMRKETIIQCPKCHELIEVKTSDETLVNLIALRLGVIDEPRFFKETEKQKKESKNSK